MRLIATAPRQQAGKTIVSIVGPSILEGTLRVPGDKSISHRAIMMSALADGPSRIIGLSDGADVLHTLAAMQALGATVEPHEDGTVTISGGSLSPSAGILDMGNSGTGIRLLAGLLAGLPFRSVLDGDASVRSRPMDRIAIPLRMMGAQVEGNGNTSFAPLVIHGGQLRGIDYSSPVASAQIKSAVLLAGLHAIGTTIVREPAISRRHTEEMLAARGAAISVDGTTTILEPSTLKPLDTVVAGDPSQAAFWLAAAAALPGSDLTVADLYLGPARSGFIDVLTRMGAQLETVTGPDGASTVRVVGGTLRATDIEPDEVPGLVDEIPILAVVAALADGTTHIRGAGELRVKETDRVATIAEMLTGFGIAVVERPDGLDITGGTLRAGRVNSHGDHRIAMAAAMAGIAAAGETTIANFDAVATSYPSFLRDLAHCAPGSVDANED